MTSLALELGRTVLGWLFVTYTVVAVSHYLLQLLYAHRTYRLQRSETFLAAFPDGALAVDVVVPSYNEDPALLEACVRSAFAQDHLGPVRVIVVDDGSPNRAALDATYDRLEADGAVVIRSPRNVGKRHAQALALPRCEGEILVTVDSDTVLAPDAIRRLTRQFKDPRVGAATGFVDVLNNRKNFLTRVQRIRYWMAFKQERAAQSWFRSVLCCSGPLAAYRRRLVERVAPAYLSQYYGGVACTFGDDRHLTNLILGTGHDTVFDAGAVAYTNVPENLRQFLRQQLRWSKSFYRELVWTVPFIGSRPWYSRFDLACLVAMPMMLTLTAGVALIFGLFVSPAYLIHFAIFITIAAAIRITYAVARERDLGMYLFIVYGFVSAFLLLSVRLVAMSTLTDARWGTRGPVLPPLASGPLSRLRAVVQPTGLVAAPVSWPTDALSRMQPGPDGKRPQFDGAWRAGVSRMMAHPNRMMAHPGSSAPPSGGLIAGAMDPIVALAPEPTRSATLGPTCKHASRPGALFCRACGAPYAPIVATAIDRAGPAIVPSPSLAVASEVQRLARVDPMSLWPDSRAVWRAATPASVAAPAPAKHARKARAVEPRTASSAAPTPAKRARKPKTQEPKPPSPAAAANVSSRKTRSVSTVPSSADAAPVVDAGRPKPKTATSRKKADAPRPSRKRPIAASSADPVEDPKPTRPRTTPQILDAASPTTKGTRGRQTPARAASSPPKRSRRPSASAVDESGAARST